MIEHYRVGDVQVCAVVTPLSTYVVEPYRFSIGVTRSAMVDEHLSQLVRNDAGWHPDAETLTEARAEFVAAERARGRKVMAA